MIVLLLLANIAVYVVMVAKTGATSWSAGTLFAWGGDLGRVSLHGQPWRLVSAMFIHASPMHLAGNMVLLLVTGSFLERKLGSVRFLAIYLASGIAGSLLGSWINPAVVSIGASGAIAGLLGAMVTLKLAARAPEISSAWIWQVVGINAVYSFAPNVDGLAHLGGFVCGLGLGALTGLHLPVVQSAPRV